MKAAVAWGLFYIGEGGWVVEMVIGKMEGNEVVQKSYYSTTHPPTYLA